MKKKLLIAVAGIFVAADIAAVAFAAVVMQYNEKWYPKTTINGIDVSGESVAKACEAIQENIDTYSLTVNGRDNLSVTIKGTDIGLRLESEDRVYDLFDKEHEKKLNISKMFSEDSYEIPLDVTYDKEKLESIIENSSLMKGDGGTDIQSPVNAYVEYSKEEKRAKIIPEEDGNVIIPDNLNKYLEEKIRELSDEINIYEDKYVGVYEQAKKLSTSDSIQSACETFNSTLYQWLSFDMGEGVYETITPEDISEWITLKKSGKTVLDKEKMALWIEEFCLKYKTVGLARKFTTHDGKVIEVPAGDYGWRIDYEKAVETAYELLTSDDRDYGLVEQYMDDPSDEVKNALTTVIEPEYQNKGFRMNYTNPSDDWDHDNYSEVDISEQKVYVYKDGELAYTAICVTGLERDPERRTKRGCFYIKEKKEDYVLKGADYQTPTKFWIRITWSGTGYHYMNRRDWKSWDKDLYKRRGSHGCINLQYEDVKTIYGLVSFNDAVFIHD